jgi:hypothetical protein
LPDIGITDADYVFGVRVYKKTDPSITSIIYITRMSLEGNIDSSVTWLTDSNLGILDNGEISSLSVVAEHSTSDLFYSLASGDVLFDTITVDYDTYTVDTVNITADSTSIPVAYLAGPYIKLPQGLTLLPSGNIVGRVSFKTFSIDSGTTTFDSDFATRREDDPTTFDLTYTFTVLAHYPATAPYSISSIREFTILINAATYGPHNELYCKALPPEQDRLAIDSFLQDDTIIADDAVYRLDDPFFASATEVTYQHAFGMTPKALADYATALELNHYNKNLILGEINIAQALDDNGDILYEVIYSKIIDTGVNAAGESPAAAIDISYPALDDGVEVTTVYPNSLENMREQVIAEIGQDSKLIPRWMLSKQANGEILGFTPSWVIAYAKPGKGALLQYKITEALGTSLNLIDFEVDRYTINSRMSENWENLTADTTDITADSTSPLNRLGRWVPGVQTTFDRIEGLDGVTVDNTVVTVDSNREINPAPDVLPPGYVPRDPGPYGNPYETLFDAGSCRFINPVDTIENITLDDSGDDNVSFPKKMIVNNE